MAPAVVIEPTPATTGMRPSTARTYNAITRRYSSGLSEVNSPVVPVGTMPWTPPAISRSTRASSASASTSEPSAVNGVGTAARIPRSCFAISEISFHGWRRAGRHGCSEGAGGRW